MLSKLNEHTRDKYIKFQQQGHKYWIKGSDKNISCTAFIHSFFEAFDNKNVIKGIISSDKWKNDPSYKYYQQSEDEIAKLWNLNNKTASNNGTLLHSLIENFYNTIPGGEVSSMSKEFDQFLSFYEDHKDTLKIYRTEWTIFSEELKLAGSIDAVFKNADGTYSIGDWKRSKEIKYQSFDNKTFGKHSFSHLQDCNYIHYCLQLNLYRILLETFYDVKIRDMFLGVFHPDNEKYIKIEIPTMEKEAKLMLDLRKSQIRGCAPLSGSELRSEDVNPQARGCAPVNPHSSGVFTGCAHLSEKQKRAYDLMCKGENIFLTGPGGTGKTHLLKLFSHEKKLYKNVGITSTTGVSALLINGTTLHSFLGINLGKEDAAMLYMRIKKKSYIVKRWKELDVLIIDEISMLSPVLFEKLESIARLIRKNEKPFGGIQLILTGDFLQLPNVDMPNAFCFEAESWNICVPNIVYLTDIFRQDDDGFKTILNEARIDELSDESIKILKSRENVELTNEAGIVPTKIYSLNVDVNRENEEALDRLVVENENLEFYEYKRIHMLMKKDLKFYDEKLNKFSSCVENLQICVGAQVMLTINLDLDGGLVNGSRGIVESFEDGMPVVKFLNGVSAFIDYHEWIIEENGVNLMCITQIPLKVAYAVTIHKCQGMTLDCAEIDFNGIFEKSQGYVALSRVKTLGGLTIKNFDESKIFVNPKAKNFYEKLNNI